MSEGIKTERTPWMLETVTLRIEGAKLHENYGIPVAAGFRIGFIAITFIGGLIGIYRFSYPFQGGGLLDK